MGPGLDMVVGRVGGEVGELRGLVSAAILRDPGAAAAEPVVAEHVEQRHRADDRAVEFGPLRHRCADQEAAVAAASNGQLLRAGPAGRDEVFGGGVEVVEDVLLAVEHAGLMPCLAILTAAAQVGDRVDATELEPGHHR